ncbi:hypothetical protein LINGRAHAP2_LOCUS4681, partial [Linum grandiflorum]
MRTNKMDEIEVVLKRFGDEHSTLVDQFERLSFEVQLNQAILARSLSEPGVEGGRNRVEHPLTLRDHIAEPAVVVKQKKRRGRGGSSGWKQDPWMHVLIACCFRCDHSSSLSLSLSGISSFGLVATTGPNQLHCNIVG